MAGQLRVIYEYHICLNRKLRGEYFWGFEWCYLDIPESAKAMVIKIEQYKET